MRPYIPPQTEPQGPTCAKPGLAITGVGLGVFMATMDFSIVNISLPTLMAELQASLATVEWVIISYALVVTSLMLGAARLGDMLGKRRVYLYGLAVFSVGSLLCALAGSAIWLIIFRAVQALGAVMMQAMSMGIVTEVAPRDRLGRVFGIMGSIVALGLAAGPPLGGLLIGAIGWRAVFWVNVPVGLLAWVVVARCVPESPPLESGQRFDAAGALLLFVCLTAYALGVTLGQQWGFERGEVWGLLGLSAVTLVAFLRLEASLAQPMLDLSLFKDRIFGLNLIMAWLAFLLMGGTFTLPFILEVVLGYTPQQTGLMMMVVPVSMGITSPLAGNLADRLGSRVVSLAGLAVMTLGCLSLSTVDQQVGAWGYVLRVAPIGIGLGLFQTPNNSAIMGAAPRNRLGVASGLVALSRTLGNTSGVPLMGAFFTGHVLAAASLPPHTDFLAAPPLALIAGFRGTYHLASLLAVLGMALAVTAIIMARRRLAEQPAE